MSSELATAIAQFETPYLLEQYYTKRGEYQPEALELMKTEIEKRDITDDQLAPYREDARNQPVPEGDDERSFTAFEDTFSSTDLLLAHAVLRDAGIPFYVDNPESLSMPLEGDADHRFTIHVLESKLAEAHELLDQHFDRQEGEFRLKHTTVKDRLRAFSFFEVRLTPAESEHEVQVSFSEDERSAIVSYCSRLQKEIDDIEAKQERTVFNFDNIDEVLSALADAGDVTVTVEDLMTILEVLQVYCDDESFPQALEGTAEALLGMIEGE